MVKERNGASILWETTSDSYWGRRALWTDRSVYIKTLYTIGCQLSPFFRFYKHVLGFLHRTSNYCRFYIFWIFCSRLYHKGSTFAWYFIIVNLLRFANFLQMFSYQSSIVKPYNKTFIFVLLDNYKKVNDRYQNGCMLLFMEIEKVKKVMRNLLQESNINYQFIVWNFENKLHFLW